MTGEQIVPSSLIQQKTALHVWFEGMFPTHGGELAAVRSLTEWFFSCWGKDQRLSALGSPKFQGRAAIMGFDCIALTVSGIL